MASVSRHGCRIRPSRCRCPRRGFVLGRRFRASGQHPVPSRLAGIASEVLGRGDPTQPLQNELALGRVVIEPGAAIPEHEHPGTQLAVIMSGELTYTVMTNEVPVARAGDTVAAGSRSRLRS